LCGGYAAFVAGAAAMPILRAIIYSARTKYKVEQAEEIAPPTPMGTSAEDPFKPLPPKEVESLWEQGELATAGYTWLPPKHQLADPIMSRMVRACKAGELWLPAVDSNLSYKDSSSNRVITTLLKGDGSASSSVQVQMVTSSDTSERTAHVNLVADYTDVITHRSAAMIACYSTSEASTRYLASAKFGTLNKHKLVLGSASPALLLLPRMVASLERRLRSAARQGCSTAEMLAIDKAVIDAIIERHSEIHDDGNLAVEHVCEQRESLFSPPAAMQFSLAHASSLLSGRDTAGSVVSDPGTSISRRSDTPSKRERELQSDRDRLRSELKRGGGGGGSEKGNDKRNTFGGDSRRMGGGDKRGREVCRSFNERDGCFRRECNFRHVCNVRGRNGEACGDERHCALMHR